jgi:outer membrane lipoprotein-sorting protein
VKFTRANFSIVAPRAAERGLSNAVIPSHHMRMAVRFALFALALRVADAQSQPDVAEILKKVSETYDAVSQYEIATDSTGLGADTTSGHMLLAFRPPNRYRMEGVISGLGGDASAFGEPIIICDGSVVWFYLRKSNQYAAIPLSELNKNARDDREDLRPEAVDQFVMVRYRRALAFIGGAKVLREEAIEFAGTKVDCYVIAVPEKGEFPASTWWVDKNSYRVVRQDDADSSTVFTSIKLNEALPDDLFRFTPPSGARKMEMNH